VAVEITAVSGDDGLDDRAVRELMALLVDLVSAGAALGWVDPPSTEEVRAMLTAIIDEVDVGDAALVLAIIDEGVVGFGYWRRYARPTHHPHADLERVAVRADQQGRGLGRRITSALVELARARDVEQLTLDFRADNAAAAALYAALGFREYGRLPDFVAVGVDRYDKVLCVLDLRAPDADGKGTGRMDDQP
jgi:ribosomal protein S18 acetylase RimI-like enzyme